MNNKKMASKTDRSKEKYAVLTADLIDSERLSNQEREVVIKKIGTSIREMQESPLFDALPYHFFRGDSFQITSVNAQHAARLGLGVKAAIRSIPDTERPDSDSLIDVRISVGIGRVEYPSERIHLADGTAYRLSGRALDEMKGAHQTFILTTDNEGINDQLEMNCRLLEYYFDRWSSASAETIYYLLLDRREKEIADILGISQAAVNQRKKVAGWEGVRSFVGYWSVDFARLFSSKNDER